MCSHHQQLPGPCGSLRTQAGSKKLWRFEFRSKNRLCKHIYLPAMGGDRGRRTARGRVALGRMWEPRAWMFRQHQQLPGSCGIFKIQAGSKKLWRFEFGGKYVTASLHFGGLCRVGSGRAGGRDVAVRAFQWHQCGRASGRSHVVRLLRIQGGWWFRHHQQLPG